MVTLPKALQTQTVNSFKSASTSIHSNDLIAYLPQVCHVVASVNQNVGGPALSVTSLAEALTDHQIRSHLWTLNYANLGKQLQPLNVNLHSYPATFLSQNFRGWQRTARQGLYQLAASQLNLIHNHGVWMFPNLYARQAAHRSNLPLVISPRGMLEAWSLQHSQSRKWLAWHLYERKNLSSATLFHATSTMEAASIRQVGLQQPIAIIPNGVTIPAIDTIPPREVLTQKFPSLANKRWLLFLSRLHPKKGLDMLIQVWKTLADQFPDWQLVIAGPDLIGYQATLATQVEELHLQHRVTFTGMLIGEDKAAALGNANLFILPSHSENFGIAVAESLAHAVPVITTQGTPWQAVAESNCGWWIPSQSAALSETLLEAFQLSDHQRQAMGMNGRRFVASHYSWSAIAQSMSEVYRWILQGGAIPECVQL